MTNSSAVDTLVASVQSSHAVRSAASSLSEVNITHSGGTSISEVRSSESGALRACCNLRKLWAKAFNYRHVEDYFRSLLLTLIVSIFCLLINFVQAYYIRPSRGEKWSNINTLAVISILSAAAAAFNTLVIVYLMAAPRAYLAGLCFTLIVFQLTLYIAETAVYYQPDAVEPTDDFGDSEESLTASSVFTIVLFFVQCLTAMIAWRYWNFVFYQHDPTSNISLRSSLLGIERPSDGGAEDV